MCVTKVTKGKSQVTVWHPFTHQSTTMQINQMNALGFQPDGAKYLTSFMVTWKQPCCGCPGGADEYVSDYELAK